jgi:hypothetical protein
MGHVRLGSLPRSRKWLQVVDLLDADADIGVVAAASSDAVTDPISLDFLREVRGIVRNAIIDNGGEIQNL